jgi:hypothetical protein
MGCHRKRWRTRQDSNLWPPPSEIVAADLAAGRLATVRSAARGFELESRDFESACVE